MKTANDEPIIGYNLSEKSGQFEIRSRSGRTIMVCMDQISASHYASLLNEAFQTGYKLGYRDARKST